jgi:predicted RNA-binding Zn ribbon-like protein
MRLSYKYSVPTELALLYEFANSIDLRRFMEQGAAHAGRDELATARQLKDWMQARGLLKRGEGINAEDHSRALALRQAVRSFLQVSPEDRLGKSSVAERLTDASRDFPLVLTVSRVLAVSLQPASGAGGLGRILAELLLLAATDRLDRLKVCASDECQWVFFDRSKPGNRRWCSSALCGNRHKTRTYRRRHRRAASGAIRS